MKELKIIFYLLLFIIPFCISGCKKNKPEQNDSSDWRGFNLLGLFTYEWQNTGYTEEEFSLIHQLGFNYVRLPIDYRNYTFKDNWISFNEEKLQLIDKAVEWGQKYNIHVCINLHRAPGYCVNNNPSTPLPANENLDLWTDTIAQKVFYTHWEMFAKRYMDVPASDLSFNLVNEPPGDIEPSVYAGIMKKATEKIRESFKDRLVVVDGLNYGRDPLYDLTDDNIIQSFHMYDPMQVSHYKASWISGSDAWDVPVWPLHPFSSYLYGPDKSEFKSALVIKGNFTENTNVIIHVVQVSVLSKLTVKADNIVVFNKTFIPSAGTGEWSKVIETQWGYQNIYNRNYSFSLPANTTYISINNTQGDWMSISSIRFESSDTLKLNPGYGDWGSRQDTIIIASDGDVTDKHGKPYEEYPLINKWIDFSMKEKVKIMVGEFGVYKFTPHDVALRFLEGQFKLYHQNKISWAMWNFIGDFGVFNSGRSDVQYENFHGYQLDREMLDLLKKY